MNQEDPGLPAGWQRLPLIEVADVIMGQSPPSSTYNTDSEGLPFFQGKSEFGEDHPTVRKWCTAPSRVAQPGDVLMSVRAPVGPTNIADRTCAIGRGLAAIRPRDGIPTSLIRHAIKFQEDEIASWGTGTTFSAISKHHFNDIVVHLPPTDQREPLALLLDQIMQRRRNAVTQLNAASLAISRSRQSVLAAACTGRLTADWRVNNPFAGGVGSALKAHQQSKRRRPARERAVDLPLPNLPDSYVVSSVGDTAVLLEYGTSQRLELSLPGGLPVLRMGNIQDGRLNLEDLKYHQLDSELKRLLLEDGDLIFNRTNSPELVGKSAVFHGIQQVSFASYLIRVRFAPDVAEPDFVNYWINSSWGRQWARLAKTDGVSQSNINGTKLALMPLPLPPIDEQRLIVERASKLLETAHRIERQVEAARRKIEQSSQAILIKAFRGELLFGNDAAQGGNFDG